jgi:hypothetical protein
MERVIEPKPVKLFSGLIFSQKAPLSLTQEKLVQAFGEIDFESKVYAFDFTTYYEQEFGKDLKRKFLTFSKLIPPESLPEIKLETNKIENELSHESTGRRTVNIDPGYISLEKLVLATTKNFSHRPYLSSGIFAELTYFYKSGSFNALEWTYPDFKKSEKIDLFNRLRKQYIGKLKNMEGSFK